MQMQAQLQEQLTNQQMHSAKRMRLSNSNNNGGVDGVQTVLMQDSSVNPPANGSNVSEKQSDFEGSFSSMLRSYTQMNASEKAERVRKVLRTFTQRELEQLEELSDIMGTAGIRLQVGSSNPASYSSSNMAMDFIGHSDACGDDCAHKVELSRIDQFYSEVFF